MQLLQNASDSAVCASEIIEATLDVILLMRETIARGHGKKDGATLVHVRAMGVLRKRPGITLSDLSRHLALTLSATSRLIDGLVSRGFVAREIPARNRRTVSLHLTPAGAQVHAHARAEAQRELARLLERRPPARRAQLTRAMAELRETLEIGAPSARTAEESAPREA
jgi:MarR family transcriptional regulator, organic hydroperoxide resistance regulator